MKQTNLTDEDAANIGRAFMELLPEDYYWAVCPTEYLAGLQDRAYDAVRVFAQRILHGDAKHQAWLLEAADRFASGDTLPKMPPPDSVPSGGGQ